MKVYELPIAYMDIMRRIDEAHGELTQELEEELLHLNDSIVRKVDSIASMAIEYGHEETKFRAEARRISGRAQVCEHTKERLRRLLLDLLKQMDLVSLKGHTFKVRRTTTANPTIRWTSNDPIPEPFQLVRVTLDTEEAKKAYHDNQGILPQGFEVTFTEFVQIT